MQALPLFFYRWSPVSDTVVFPLGAWHHDKGDDAHTVVAGPLYVRRASHDRAFVLFPLFWSFADDLHERATSVAGPVYWWRTA